MTTEQILTGIKDWVLSKLSLKQDVINDLAAIRSGSQAGSTAVQPSDLSSYFNDASYDTSTHRINFYHGQDVVAYVDASPFIVDGMVDDVRIENGYLVIDFNTDSGKQDISIPLTDIFDPSNYYNKTQTDALLGNKVDKVSGKGLSTNDYSNAEKEKLSGLQNYDDTQVRQLIGQKQDIIQDLEDIRSGASAGATAVQPYTLNSALSDTVAESGVYDVTANNNNAKFASLSALLGSENIDTLIPSAKRKGGMSIKFVQSSDNKYVQYMCKESTWSIAPTDWEKINNVSVSQNTNTGGVNLGIGNQVIKSLNYRLLELGGILTTNGHPYSADHRARTGYLRIASGFSIIGNPQIYAIYFYDDEKQFITSEPLVNWTNNTSDEYEKAFDGYIRIVVRHEDDTALTDAELTNIDDYITLKTDREYANIVLSSSQIGKDVASQTICERQRTKEDAVLKIRTSGPFSSEETADGTCLKVIFPIKSGELVYARCYGYETTIVIYDSIDNAKTSYTEGILQNITHVRTSWCRNCVSDKSECNGYLLICIRKLDQTAITDVELETIYSELFVLLGGYNSLQSYKGDKVYLGSLTQNGQTASGLGQINSKRVTEKCVIAIPINASTPLYNQPILYFKLPKHIKCGFRHGADADNLSNNTYWQIDGDIVKVPATSKFFRFSFAKYDTTLSPYDYNYMFNSKYEVEVSVDEINKYIEEGTIEINFLNYNNSDVIDDNKSCDGYVKAVRFLFSSSVNDNTNQLRLPLFIHTSDTHADQKRFARVVRYANYLGVDALLNTGDVVAYNPSNNMDYVNAEMDKSSLPILLCMGNHDAYGSSVEEQYNNILKYGIDKYSLNVDSQVSYPTYYYKDFSAKKIRVIALNEFDRTLNGDAYHSYYTQQQINWFIATLLSTPQDYGVIVMFHRPEVPISKITGYDKFYQDSLAYADYQRGTITNTPISTIVDAFISGGTLNTTFTEKNTAKETETINMVADFSGKNSGVEFLFFANGHEHADRIGIVPNTTNRQLVMNVICTTSIYDARHPYYAELSDLPRGYDGFVQDAFNLYAIDRANHNIRVARIGSNMTSQLKLRDYMVVSYI